MVSRLFRNHKQISPDQVVRQVHPLWNGALEISDYTWADLSSQSNNIRRVAGTTHEGCNRVPGWDNLKRPMSAPAVTLSQQPHTNLGGKN
ncbi:hypothetical protein T4C_8740 [Trichinella pseudospiralis]|uniref:Uncharacterized protein n=1 Tax=Trichinella pseudospiralis TaxID=6337 RepID=A0A0V1IP73_TRIPS|nr:hypothetical protein T4C_8740 [Trichinella pseudospiralis]